MAVISRFTVFLKGVVFQVYARKLGECLDHAFGFVPLLFATIFNAASSDRCWDFPAMILFCLRPHDCIIVDVFTVLHVPLNTHLKSGHFHARQHHVAPSPSLNLIM